MFSRLIFLLLLFSAGAFPADLDLRFDFTASESQPGYVKVSRSELYSEALGYGFEPTAAPEKPPYYFSVRVPEEGNYQVMVTLGDPSRATVTTVKAELRRLMMERVRTAPGEIVRRSFIVN